MLNHVKRRAVQLVHLVHRGIDRFWVDPLEYQIIPRLESGKQTRLRSATLRWASWCANVGRVAVLDLRVEVKRWAGPEWTVTYIGDGTSIEALCTILFPEPPKVNELPRVFLWQVPALVQKFSDEGDLVVCELNEIVRWSPNGLTTSFVVPRWIKQVLEEIDRPMENVLASMNQTMRRKIRQLEKEEFSYIFTQNKEEFDFFYYRMYLPYIKLRHEGQGMILDDYESVHNLFMKGGLILIKDGQDPVCGMVCTLDGDKCTALEMGVLDGDFDLVKRGINVALWWFMLLWAREQGAQRFDFGSSLAQTSDGVFNFKRQWGTRVYLHKGIHTQWSFYAQALPDKLRKHLNALEIITSLDGKCYRVIMTGPTESSSTADFTPELKHADKCGLAGLMVISENGKRQVISQSSS